MSSNSVGRLGRWAIVVATITGLMLFAIALYLLTNSERRLRAIDERNAADLATIVDNLEQWPAAAAAIATQNAFDTDSATRGDDRRSPSDATSSTSLRLYHPDFGRYVITYSLEAKCAVSSKLKFGTNSPVFSFAGEVPNDRNDGKKLLPALRPTEPAKPAENEKVRTSSIGATEKANTNSICYRLELPLERMIRLKRTAPGLPTILIAEQDQRIVQQIGVDTNLPINSVSDLHEEDSPYISALRDLFKSDSPKTIRVAGIEGPINTRIGNKVYRAYTRSFLLRGSDGSNSSTQYSAVGVVNRSTMVASGPRTPMKWIIVFTLAFALLLALTPSLKLLLLGPVEALRPVEVAAIGVGLVAAAAIATATIGLGASVLAARYDADIRIAATAQWMAREIDQEIVSILDPMKCSLPPPTVTQPVSDYVDGASLALGTQVLGENLYTRSVQPVLERADPPIDFERPESAFVADNVGEQYSTLTTRRDQAGGRAYITGREYFDRIKSGDLLTRTVRTAQAFTAAGETFSTNRYTIGRVLARPDGLIKSIVTIPVDMPRPGEKTPSALTFAWVSKPLLAPALPSGVEFAVVDLASPDLLVLAHSIPNRPQIERARFAFDAAGVAAIDGLAHARQPACGDALAEPIRFAASYDGRTRHFAALRIPCTTWAVLTNVGLDQLDEQSAKEALWALIDWSTLVVAVALALALRSALGHEIRFAALWPDPRLLPVYDRRSMLLLRLCLASGIAILIFALLSPDISGAWMVAFAVPAATAFILFRQPTKDEESTDREGKAARLTPAIENAFSRCLFAAMTCFAVVPVTAFMIDAHQDAVARRTPSALVEEAQRVDTRSGQMLAVARTYYPDIRDRALSDIDRASWGGKARVGDYRLDVHRPIVPAATYTGSLRSLVGERSTNVPNTPRPRAAPADPPSGKAGIDGWCALIALAIALVVFMRHAVRRVLAGLFGFGVPLKAVDYPEIPSGLWSVFSERTMIVAAPDHIRRAITNEPDILKIDLFNLKEAGDCDKILVTNLELVLQNDARRLAALVLLEALVEAQDQDGGKSSIVVLSSLSPLERLLHGYDRANDTADFYTVEEERLRRRKFTEDGEALRWSRLFESFDTYYSHDRPSEVGEYKLDHFGPEQRKIAATVYRELDYLPLSILETGLPEARDGTDPARSDDRAAMPAATASPEISRDRERHADWRDHRIASVLKQRWAEKLSGKRSLGAPDSTPVPAPAAGPRAVIDYFAALFIEHYQLAWSASSHGERLLLYHLAHGRFVNIERAYQLGPLVRRGLVMLNPELQLLNRSFAQFVRHAENPDTIATWHEATPKSAWSRAQAPVMLAIAFGLCVLLVFAVQSGDSIASYVPVLIGAVPALLHSLGVMRKSGQ